MAKIILAQLGLDEKAFLQSAQRTKESIDKLVIAQKALKKAGKTASQEFVKNGIVLKKLRTDYVNQQKAVIALESPYAKLSNRLIRARREFKDLAATTGISNKRLTEARTKVLQLDRQLKKIDKSVGQSQRNVGNYGSALKGLATSFLGVTAVIFGAIRAIKSAISTFSAFEKQNATLSAILQVEKEDMVDLKEESKRLGATTAKTATEVVGLQIAFARLGFSQEQIIDLTEATISGSIAMNAELDQTANLVGAMVNSFDDFDAVDAPEIIDVLALATAKSALNFEKLQKGLPIVAGAANAAGIPFNTLVALMGKLADSGIDVSTSSTAIRNIFIESAKQGEDYNQIIERIKGSQDKLTAATDAFGKRAAVSASVIANNIEKTKELEVALDDAAGTAQRMADKELATLEGMVTLLTSAWSGLITTIEDGDGAISASLKSIIGGLTGFLGSLSDIVTVSEGFFDNWINGYKLFTESGRKSLKTESDIKKANEKRIRLANELVELIDKQAKATGFGIDKEQEMATVLNKTTEQIKAHIKEIKDESQAVIDAEKVKLQAVVDAEVKKKELSKKELKKQEAERKKREKQEKQDLITFAAELLQLENEAELIKITNEDERKKLKLDQDAQAQKDKLAKLIINKTELAKAEKLIDEQLQSDKDEIDLAHTVEFDKIKNTLDNELALLKKESDEEKEVLKLEQEIEKRELFLEKTITDAEELATLKALLQDEEDLLLAGIRKKWDDKEEKEEERLAKAKIARRNKTFDNAVQIAGAETRLGKALLAVKQILDLKEQIMDAKKTAQKGVQAISKTAINVAEGTGETAKIGFPQNIPALIAYAAQVVGIISAVRGAVSASKSSFYEGGQVPNGTGGRISGSNIPTQRGGDNILATVKSGEVILNEEQQQRAGGSAFFNSIGVPGFADGGAINVPQSIITQSGGGINTEAFVDALADKINDIKIVAIEEEITSAQAIKTEIISGANI